MTQIPGIYVPISADLKQLKSDMGQAKQIITSSANSMSNALNGALSGSQAKKGITDLVSNLSKLSQSSKITGQDFSKLGVDLGSLQKITGVTGSQFAKLQSQLLQTQAAKAQKKALRDIARQAGLTQKEIATLGKQFGLSQAQIANVAGSTAKVGSSFNGLLGYITPAIAGMVAFQKVTALVSQEFVYGLKAVEDFGMSIAQSTALITTFSQRAKQGDLAGAYRDANVYAKELTLTLEMIDQKTIANSADLRAMSETFIANGVLLDINNKKQVEGFTSVANALAIMTQGQNKEIQMRQEIRGLMDGEIRSQDKLGMLLKAQIPDIEKQLVIWRNEGTTLEHLAELLKGFNAVTGQLEDQWSTVGSTMETIHNRILRGMFEPVFNDLIKLAKDFNKSMMDAEGQLTPLARGVIKLFQDGYSAAKSFFDENDKGWANMIANATLYGQIINLGGKAFGLAKDFLSDYGNSAAESAEQDIASVEQAINDFKQRLESGGDDWWEFQLFKDPNADKKHLQELTAEFERLGMAISAARSADAGVELRRTGGAPKLYAPTLYNPPPPGDKSKATDFNAALQAEVELLKSAEETKLQIIKAGIENDQLINQQAYDLGLSSYGRYLDEKNDLTQRGLQAELDARKRELEAAQDAANKLSPITDKEGNARPDKNAKARADAEKRVEDAKRSVIKAEQELQKAESEGAHAAQMAAEDRINSYRDLGIQLLESQGKSVEVAVLMAKYDEESVEHKRLLLEVENEVAGAREALAAKEELWAKRTREASLDRLSTEKEALLAIAQIDGEYYKSLDVQTDLLDIEIQRAKLAGALPAQIALLQRQRQEIERMKQPMSAFVKGWQDVIKAQKTTSEQMYELARETATDLQETFSDTFFAVMKGDFESIGDLWEDMLGRMLDSFLRTIADMVAAWASTEIFEMFFGTGTGISFSASGKGGKGSSAGSAVGGLATSVAGSYAQNYIMESAITPIVEAIGGYLTGTGAAGAIGAGTASAGTIGAGTASPAVLDAYVAAQAAAESAVAAETAAATTATAVETSGSISASTSIIGTNSAAGGSTAAGAGMSAGAGMAMGGALMAWIVGSRMLGSTANMAENLNFQQDRLTPQDISDYAGSRDGVAVRISNEAMNQLADLNAELAYMSEVSVDTANGVMIASREIVNDRTLEIESMQYQMLTFDQSTQKWTEQTDLFGQMVREMTALGPVTDDAIAGTAKYLTEMYGVPTAADELIAAFMGLTTGVYGLAGAAQGAAGAVSSAISSMYAGMSRSEQEIALGQSAPVDERQFNLQDIVGHANGGYNSGWTWVGERGKELIYTPPSQIFSNSDSNKLMANAGKSGQPVNLTIPISVGNEPLTTLMVRVADGVATVRQQQNVTGRAYI